MNNFDLQNYKVTIVCENDGADAKLETAAEGGLSLYLTAERSKPMFVKLSWEFESDADLLVLGDAWERSYGDLQFLRLSENDRYMPWYFAAADRETTYCFGVKTRPNAFVCFRYTQSGITAYIDCRNGSGGVELGGRTVKLCTFVFESYSGGAFAALQAFCKKLCSDPLLPAGGVYGFNNWYYAYGESSFAQIVSDTKLLCSLSAGLPERPFMVIDDGWQPNPTQGPWIPNEKFRDMKALADEIRSRGARPGIWVRLLDNETSRCKVRGEYLDPTVPEVRRLLQEDILRMKGWGYELLKHDFSTVDLFGHYGKDLGKTITKTENWHFADTSKTNAEVVLDFYKLIKDTCGDMLVLGCNTISHLSAGLVHLSRTGDDTSGREWARTLKMGVNTLAFRLAQNGAFYMADADCVGILEEHIDWAKNRQWLDLLAKSSTALFVSAKELNSAQFEDVRRAFAESQEPHTMEPLDWFETRTPAEWLIDGERVRYHW